MSNFTKEMISNQICVMFSIREGDTFSYEFDHGVNHGIVLITRSGEKYRELKYIRQYNNIQSAVLTDYDPHIHYKQYVAKKNIVFRFVATGNRDVFSICKILGFSDKCVKQLIKLAISRYDHLLSAIQDLHNNGLTVNEISDSIRFACDNYRSICSDLKVRRRHK